MDGVALAKNSPVNSGASSGSTQELFEAVFFVVIGIPHADNTTFAVAGCPNQNNEPRF
jgi:hypothetical protein